MIPRVKGIPSSLSNNFNILIKFLPSLSLLAPLLFFDHHSRIFALIISPSLPPTLLPFSFNIFTSNPPPALYLHLLMIKYTYIYIKFLTLCSSFSSFINKRASLCFGNHNILVLKAATAAGYHNILFTVSTYILPEAGTGDHWSHVAFIGHSHLLISRGWVGPVVQPNCMWPFLYFIKVYVYICWISFGHWIGKCGEVHFKIT